MWGEFSERLETRPTVFFSVDIFEKVLEKIMSKPAPNRSHSVKDTLYGMAIGDILTNDSNDSYSSMMNSTLSVCDIIVKGKIEFDDTLALTILSKSDESFVTGIEGMIRLIPASFLPGDDVSLVKYLPSLGCYDFSIFLDTSGLINIMRTMIFWDSINIDEYILGQYTFIDVIEDEIPTFDMPSDSLYTACWAFVFTDSFEECLQKAYTFKGNTKAISIIAGALAGTYYGYDRIPKYMIDKLPKSVNLDNYLF